MASLCINTNPGLSRHREKEKTRHKLKARDRKKELEQQSSKVSDTDSHKQTLAIDPES